MPTRKQIQPGETVPLKLTVTERKLVLEDLMCLDQDYEEIVRGTPTSKPVMMTLDDLDDFGGYIAAEANHCNDKKKQKKLDAVFQKVQDLLGKYTDEEPPQIVNIEDARKEKVISDQTVQIAEFAAKALVAAEQLRIKMKPLEDFWLAPGQRDLLLLVPGLSKSIKNKLAKDKSSFTVVEVASMTMALAVDLLDGGARKQIALLLVAKHLMDRLQEGIIGLAEPKAGKKSNGRTKAATDLLFQFKITLLDIKPAIWRRIQVQDCTLVDLHEHIQTVMGWENYHLHQFDIDGVRYSQPAPDGDDFDMDFEDETDILLSQLIPKSDRPSRWIYAYDFGDDWRHEVQFEGSPAADPKAKYPLCLEGERACPPEDCGGPWGFADYLKALADRQHEQHEELLEWRGPFNPEAFDVKKATSEMQG
jgi:hypothetical protein